jgi:putative ABC transport system permease protein
VAVRAALGASRFRIVRQLITESLLLALIAGVVGTLLALWGARALTSLSPADVVRFADTGIDKGVLTFTAAVSVLTSVLFGLVPALHASKIDLIDALKQTARSVGGSAARTRSALVISEIALAVVLLTGAGLMIKSLVALQNVDLGFEPENVLVMKASGVRSRQENNVVFGQILSRVRAVPGVVAAGATSIPPGDMSLAGSGFYFIDRMPAQRDRSTEPGALLTIVAPGSFAALGVPLKSGRDFNDGDTAEAPLVAIVNEALVRKAFATSENPIGRTIFCSFDRPDGMTIVGVVGDVRQNDPAHEPARECYMPYQQHSYNSATLNFVIRTSGEPTALAPTLRSLAMQISPEVPVSFTTMEANLSKRVQDPRLRAMLFGAFAGLALCLAMAGVYGVMAYGVEQRSKEIGLRVALGATQGSVLRLILGQGLVLAAAGVAVGLAAAVAVTRLLTTMLFAVKPIDAQVYAGVVVLLSIVTLVAGYIPASRASVVDPVEVLKTE